MGWIEMYRKYQVKSSQLVLVRSSGRSRITREKELHFSGTEKREEFEDI